MAKRRKVDIAAPKNTARRYIHRVLIGVPTLGIVRIEWHNAMQGIVIPTNWSNSMRTPIGFTIDDAQNLIVHDAMEQNFEWVLLIEDDVLVPGDLFIRFRAYMESARYPLVAGLYHLKGTRPEPMIYRGRGNGPYVKWKAGEKVACDGLPTGCTLIHVRLLRAVAEKAPWYSLRVNKGHTRLRRIFETPRLCWTDPKLGSYKKLVGTSDLVFCDRVIDGKFLAEAGWKALAKKRYPFIVDTRIRCGHIDRHSGHVY